jgi:hypothetical protein
MTRGTHEARYEMVLDKLLAYGKKLRESFDDQLAQYLYATEEGAQRQRELFVKLMKTEYELDLVNYKLIAMVHLKEYTLQNVFRLEFLIIGTKFQERFVT